MTEDLLKTLEDQHRVEHFLFHEAELLDDFKLMPWLDLLSPDIDYRIPTRTTRLDSDMGNEFSETTFFMVENFESLKVRMERFGLGGWSEFPPSRTRRLVSNVRVLRQAGKLTAKSNLLLYWARDMAHEVVSCERRDVYDTGGETLRLSKRLVLLDHVSLPLPSLTVAL